MNESLESDPRWFGDSWGLEAIQMHTMKLLTLLFSANFGLQPTHPEVSQSWRQQEQQLMQQASLTLVNSLLRLTAIINCGLGVSAYKWSEDYMAPLKVNFLGRWLLALVPNIAISEGNGKYQILEAESEYFLVACNSKAQNLYIRVYCHESGPLTMQSSR